MRNLLVALVVVLVGCGSVTSSELRTDGGTAGAGGSSSNDAAASGSAGSGPSAGANGADAGGRGGSSSNAGAGGTAACRPATVALTAGETQCNCGGTCGDCPTADGPTCGGTGLGHRNWFGCTVNGAPYFGCAWGAAPNDAGVALGYCCKNNCSESLCEP